jgi:glycerol kinase
MGLLIGLDHGGSTTTALALSTSGEVLGRHSLAMARQVPRPGWVEHDPEDFITTSLGAIDGVLAASGCRWHDVEAVGIANQGETTIAWDSATGRAVGPAISWQDKRTTAYCEELVRTGHEEHVRQVTGLPIDPYFSASKIHWLITHSDAARSALARGTLRVGGTDAFLIARLTREAIQATDVSTASRTALLNLRSLTWDEGVAGEVFEVPLEVLPELRPSIGGHFGGIDRGGVAPITSDIVDAHAALFAQGCLTPDVVKVTYGTGAFIEANVGPVPTVPSNGLLPFVAWQLDGDTSYSVEGGVFDVGAAVDWLVDMGLLPSAAASGAQASSATEGSGVVVVPTFSGMAAPRWQPNARAAILGMGLDTTPADLVRGVLRGIAFSVAEIIDAIADTTHVGTAEVRADGGPTGNAFLMQLQADLSGRPISVSQEPDLTAFGAAAMAGVGAGALTVADAMALAPPRRVYEPALADDERLAQWNDWRRAVDAVADHAEPQPKPPIAGRLH